MVIGVVDPVVCLLTAVGVPFFAADDAAAAGAKLERPKSAATAAAMRARFIGILLRTTVISTPSPHTATIRGQPMVPTVYELMMSPGGSLGRNAVAKRMFPPISKGPQTRSWHE